MAKKKSTNPMEAGPVAKGRYYTPASRITLVSGVEFAKFRDHADRYTGEPTALEQMGLLRADMFPASGRFSISWRPDDVERDGGESWMYVPGYMEVRFHPSGKYHVFLTVSREEQAARRAATERRELEQRRQWEADAADRERQRPHQPAPITGAKSEEEYRETSAVFPRMLRNVLIEGIGDGGPYSYALGDDDREAVSEAIECIEAAIAHGNLAVNRAMVARLQLMRGHAEAQADAPLQSFLKLVVSNGKRRKSA